MLPSVRPDDAELAGKVPAGLARLFHFTLQFGQIIRMYAAFSAGIRSIETAGRETGDAFMRSVPNDPSRQKIRIENTQRRSIHSQFEAMFACGDRLLRLPPALVGIKMLQADGQIEGNLTEQLHSIGTKGIRFESVDVEYSARRPADNDGERRRSSPTGHTGGVPPRKRAGIIQKVVADIGNGGAKRSCCRALTLRLFVGEDLDIVRVARLIPESRNRDQPVGGRVMPGDERHSKPPDLHKHAHDFTQQFLARPPSHDGPADMAGRKVHLHGSMLHPPANSLSPAILFRATSGAITSHQAGDGHTLDVIGHG